jgi:hypothetical protein
LVNENLITLSTDSFGSDIGIHTLNLEQDKTNSLSNSVMLARSGVPESHRCVADNYMIIKKIFGFPAVQSKISIEERKFLARFDFNTLEYSTIKQVNEELSFLKKWSDSKDSELQSASDRIIQIRAKELKYLIATSYVEVTNEIYKGYKALERYFEEISKYNQN